MIKIGELSWSSGDPKQGKDQNMKNFNRWSKRVSEHFVNSHQGLFSFPYVFIYLMDGDKPICFFKDSVLNYTDPNAKTKWVAFEPDLAIGKVKDKAQAGIFCFRLYLH